MMKKILILFIHGLDGNKETWKNVKAENDFGELLLEEEEIRMHCDIDYFEYDATMIKKESKIANFIKLVFGDGNTKKDLTLEDHMKKLKTCFNYRYEKYEKIILIAHSLGGLVSKKYIVSTPNNKVELFISLAVPYKGSKLAKLSKIPIASKNAKELKPASEVLEELDTKWLQTEYKNLPYTVYVYGQNDDVVDEKSALIIERAERNYYYRKEVTSDTHISISKPLNKDSDIFLIVSKEIKKILSLIKEDDFFLKDNNKLYCNVNDEEFLYEKLKKDLESTFLDNLDRKVRNILTLADNEDKENRIKQHIVSYYKGKKIISKLQDKNEKKYLKFQRIANSFCQNFPDLEYELKEGEKIYFKIKELFTKRLQEELVDFEISLIEILRDYKIAEWLLVCTLNIKRR